MSAETDAHLASLLILRAGESDILNNRESARLEFKQSFSFANQASYARTMVGFANNHGGYIVFGVEDSPHRLIGVDLDKFVRFDPAPLTDFLGTYVTPLVEWEFGSIKFAGFPLGYLYTEPCSDKPVMAAASYGNEIKDGDIYYRYSGQTRSIKHAELTAILEQRLRRERRAWMSHMEHISRAGPSNVGILDMTEGEMYSGDATFLIDDAPIQKIKFIRKGQFDDVGGEPTLRLVGDLHEVSSVVAPVQVPKGIHMADLIKAAVEPQDLPSQTARSFLRETVNQNSPMSPVFRISRLAGFDWNGAVDWVSDASTGFTSTRKRVVDRLRGVETLGPTGTPPRDLPVNVPSDPQDLVDAANATKEPVEQRGLLVAALHHEPAAVIGAIEYLSVTRLCEALMHVDTATLSNDREDMWKVVRSLLELWPDRMSSSERSIFRRSVAYLDQQLYSWHTQ